MYNGSPIEKPGSIIMLQGAHTATQALVSTAAHWRSETHGRADRVGCAQVPYVAVFIPPLFHRAYRRQTLLKVCGIDCYDDLLLPGRRFLAQLQVFASGEHFKNNFLASSGKVPCSTGKRVKNQRLTRLKKRLFFVNQDFSRKSQTSRVLFPNSSKYIFKMLP